MKMARLTTCLALVLVTGTLTEAQGIQDTRIKAEQTATPDGHVYFTITNESNMPITAIAIFATRTPPDSGIHPARSTRFFDCIINPFGPGGREVMPGQSHRFSLAGPLEKRRIDASLKAVIFSDGSSLGDTQWIERMTEARQVDLNYVDQALQFLKSGKSSGTSREGLIQEAQRRAGAARSSSTTMDEKQIGWPMYQEISTNLQVDMTGHAGANQPLTLNQRLDTLTSQFLTRRQRLLSSKPPLSESGVGPSP